MQSSASGAQTTHPDERSSEFNHTGAFEYTSFAHAANMSLVAHADAWKGRAAPPVVERPHAGKRVAGSPELSEILRHRGCIVVVEAILAKADAAAIVKSRLFIS
jgi:hypothetical protein